MKNIFVLPIWSRFPILDRHLVFLVYLDLLQSTYNILWNMDNLVNNQLYNHRIDQLQFFEYYHIFLNHAFTGWSKKFFPLIITLWRYISTVGSKYHLWLSRFSNEKRKSLFTPWKLGSSKTWINICFVSAQLF